MLLARNLTHGRKSKTFVSSAKCSIYWVKPWSNGVASRRKLRTSMYLTFRLARPWVQLRWLALTLVEIKFARKSKQVFHRLATQRKSTQVEWCSFNGLLANEIQDMSALKWVFCNSRVLVRKLASAFGHPTQVSTQVQLASTCDYLPIRLAKALNLVFSRR